MKYVIEFDLPDNDTVLNNIKTALVGWNVWGYSGSAFAKPKQPERKPQWISCRERLPDDDGEVLVSTHDFVCRGFYAYGKWYGCSYGSLYDVTAWMQLPKPYWEEGGQE